MQYVGQTSKKLKDRFMQHRREILKKTKKTFLYQHFTIPGHTINNVIIQPVELMPNGILTSNKELLDHELNWIKSLQSPYPLGFNDNIYHQGNISKNANIDIFKLYLHRKRKNRSHGIRKNRNIKRKSRRTMSIRDCYNILINSGRHSMLSSVTNLSITSLRNLDEEADKICLRSDPLYETANIIQSYTKHILTPHIDSDKEHKRYFIKIQFINKGIDFINLPGILRHRKVVKAIPNYFKNTESPIICYKYNKPIRSAIFNYNQLVSDPDVDNNIPTSCECRNSNFCYNPVGHIITGNFKIIEDAKLRELLSKGPNYRIPSKIDLGECFTEIVNSLEQFSERWCKQEKAELNALNNWKKQILSLVSDRIKFYQSNPKLLPPDAYFSLDDVKKKFTKFHAKFVLVPADKASNNIIIV